MIINNKIKATINKENLDRDFDIYRLTKAGKHNFYTSNVLDLPSLKFKAKSVVYTYGNEWYAMFDKDSIDKDQFKKAINDESPDTRVEKVENIYWNVLVSLVLNMVHVQDDDGEYNNIMGGLYFRHNDWICKETKNGGVKSFYTLKLVLNSNMFMTLKVVTFSKLSYFTDKKLQGRTQYVFDRNTGELRKKLKTDNYSEEEVYIEKSLNPKKHNTIPYLDFTNLDSFKKCKVGIYSKFIMDVEDELTNYISLEDTGYEEYKTFNSKDKTFENNNYSELIGDKILKIQDDVNSIESMELVESIIAILNNDLGIEAVKGELDKSSYNLRIIHSKEYYEENEIKDPYKEIEKDIVVQHRTIESFDSFIGLESEHKIKSNLKKEKAAITKIVQELIIKRDILLNKVTLVNWDRANFNSNWSFVKRQEIKDENSKSKNKNYIYCKMEITPIGECTYKYYDSREEYELGSEIERFEEAYSINKNGNKSVEGLCYKSIDNIHTIIRTEQFTMPNYKNLRKKLELSNGKRMVSIQDIIGSLETLETDDEEVNVRKQEFIDEISKLPKYSPLGEVNKAIKIKRKAGKVLNKHIYEELGILINSRLKDKEFKDEYFIPVLDTKYFYTDNRLYYFVGVDSSKLQLSLHNACVIREVVAQEEMEFEELFKLLKVEFVRHGQNTVVPFPFKYLNEALAKEIINETCMAP